MSLRTKFLHTLLIALCVSVASARAQEIDIRLSIKYILDASNNRPPGYFDSEQNIYDVIEETNQALRRYDRGYRFVIVGNIDEIREDQTPGSTSSAFFNLNLADENLALEDAAEADPVGFHWSYDAVNIYVVNCCGGGAAIPSNANEAGYRVVFVSADSNFTPNDPARNAQEIIWLHEIGHHFNLIHTWDSDGVSDTRPDTNPNQCTIQFGCTTGGSKECCCSTKVDNLEARANSQSWTQEEFENIRFNVMSYYGAFDCPAMNEDLITIDNMRLTEGQLDRFSDATRLYHANEVSGLTYFVDWRNTTSPFNGYSTDPFQTVLDGVNAADPTGGDIVLIRDGVYNENLLLTEPVTLRANNGIVTIGD